MSFPRRRRAVKERDRALEVRIGVHKNDPTADRFAGGNVYSTADIERLTRERLPFWRKRRS